MIIREDTFNGYYEPNPGIAKSAVYMGSNRYMFGDLPRPELTPVDTVTVLDGNELAGALTVMNQPTIQSRRPSPKNAYGQLVFDGLTSAVQAAEPQARLAKSEAELLASLTHNLFKSRERHDLNVQRLGQVAALRFGLRWLQANQSDLMKAHILPVAQSYREGLRGAGFASYFERLRQADALARRRGIKLHSIQPTVDLAAETFGVFVGAAFTATVSYDDAGRHDGHRKRRQHWLPARLKTAPGSA